MGTEIIFLLIGAVLGVIIGWLLSKAMAKTAQADTRQFVAREMYETVKAQLDSTLAELREKTTETIELSRELATADKTIENYHERLKNQQAEIEKLQQQFRLEFENLANRLLEEKSTKFTQLNQTNLRALLDPLSEKIKGFEQQLQQSQVEDTKQRATLIEQIRQLSDLNKLVTDETRNLTRALKGESKTQGNWGELVLEKILERSGLTKNSEYVTQQSLMSEELQRRQPDVVIHLPDNKHLIIDSKVSLTHYERFIAAVDSPEEQARALREHINSIKNHIRQLSDKNYPALKGMNSPDFVLMFIPLEPAFTIAMQQDNDLFVEALDRNIVLVTPTTLLATTRTIASLWKQEYQNRNAQEIARIGGDLYDKFMAFIGDLESVGDRLRQADAAYDSAMQKLHTGRGNLVRRAETLRELGAKTSKVLPDKFRQDDDE